MIELAILLAIVVVMGACCLVAVVLSKLHIYYTDKYYRRMLSRHKDLEEAFRAYNEFNSNSYEWYSQNIAPLKRAVSTMRKTFSTSTLSEYQYRSDKVDKLEEKIVDNTNKYQNIYPDETKERLRENVLQELNLLSKIEARIFRYFNWEI